MPFDSASYEAYTCPECRVRQLVYLGDLSDMIRPDVSLVQCYQCGNIERVTSDSDEFDQDGYIQVGEPCPKCEITEKREQQIQDDIDARLGE